MWGRRDDPALLIGKGMWYSPHTGVSAGPQPFATSVALLATFHAEHGRWPRRKAGEPEERRLASWLHGQRKRKDNLTPAHRALLDETVPDWDGSPQSPRSDTPQVGTDDIGRPAWQLRAACLGVGADVFFIERGGGAQKQAAMAKAVCAACPVRAECLEYGLSLPEPERHYGIWGGLTEKERRKLRRERKTSERRASGAGAAA